MTVCNSRLWSVTLFVCGYLENKHASIHKYAAGFILGIVTRNISAPPSSPFLWPWIVRFLLLDRWAFFFGVSLIVGIPVFIIEYAPYPRHAIDNGNKTTTDWPRVGGVLSLQNLLLFLLATFIQVHGASNCIEVTVLKLLYDAYNCYIHTMLQCISIW